MSYMTYAPLSSSYPIRQLNNPFAVKSPDVLIPGAVYWRITFDGYLTEIQMDLGDGPLTISNSNGVASTSLNVNLVDGVIPVGNNNFASGGTYTITGASELSIQDFWISPQVGSSTLIYNPCKTFSVSYSNDNINWLTDGFGEKQISDPSVPSSLYSPFTGSILRPSVLVKVGYSLS